MSDIKGYEDWPAFMDGSSPLSGDGWTEFVASVLGVPRHSTPEPRQVRTWEVEGLTITEMAWSPGFGPDNHGYLMHRSDVDPIQQPGLLHMHSHAGVKYIGAYRDLPIAHDDADDQAQAARLYQRSISVPTFATKAARRGFSVFMPDTFSWGARRFILDSDCSKIAEHDRLLDEAGHPRETRYDELAAIHEHIVAKAAIDLGTTYAGMIAYDDTVSLDIAQMFCKGTPAVVGHSGGGGRSINLSALCPEIQQVGVMSMMSTVAGLFSDHIGDHSWLLHTGIGRHCDMPILAANRLTHDLCVLYGETDWLFSSEGMHDADEALAQAFEAASGSYTGRFYQSSHDLPTGAQDFMIDWLAAGVDFK